MGLRRNQQGDGPSGRWTTATAPGRMLRTQLDVRRCVRLFRSAAITAGLTPHAAQAWPDVADPPTVFETALDGDDPRVHLAIWDRGDHREVDLVAVRESDELPSRLLEEWRLQDASVESVGRVRWVTRRPGG